MSRLEKLASMMVGRDVTLVVQEEGRQARQDVVLEVKDLYVRDERQNTGRERE